MGLLRASGRGWGTTAAVTWILRRKCIKNQAIHGAAAPLSFRRMDLELQGKTAIVTGASSGLGKAVAAALLAEGADVAIASRDRQRITAAGRDLEAARVTAMAIVAADAALGVGAQQVGPTFLCVTDYAAVLRVDGDVLLLWQSIAGRRSGRQEQSCKQKPRASSHG